jgi:hypothetical protein
MRDSLSEPDRYRDSHGPDANSVGNPRGCAPPRRSGQLADYYPLIALAVNRLEPSTAETRRTIYDRARAAMVAQLRSLTPTLSESDINREQLALDRAIRKVEAESLRRSRTPPQPSIRQPDTPPGPIRDTGEEQAEMSNGVEPSRYATRPRSSPVILDEDPARDDEYPFLDGLPPRGGPPALPGRQQKFDVYAVVRRRSSRWRANRHTEGHLLVDEQRMPGHKDGITRRCCGSII